MRWFEPTLNSIRGLLGQAPVSAGLSAQRQIEQVRQAMLDSMSFGGFDERHHMVVRRIYFAQDIQTLWYARSDIMTVLAEEVGETEAKETLRRLSRLFDRLLPEAKAHRRSRRPR